MKTNAIDKTGADMLYLVSCAMHKLVPDPALLSPIDLAAVYKLSKLHSIEAMIYIPLLSFVKEHGEDSIDSEILQKFKRRYVRAVRRAVAFDAERMRLLEFFTENGIWFLTLKGIVLETLYPAIGMRQMTDNDILFDAKYKRKARAYMKSRGFTVHSYGGGCHDVYIKDELTFELHHTLIEDIRKNKSILTFTTGAIKRAKDNGDSFAYKFTNEDLYLYNIVHTHKHYNYSGIGVRSLLDLYVYRTRILDGIDVGFIERELGHMGLTDFERSYSELADSIFGNDPENVYSVIESLSESSAKMLNYIMTSGTFGTEQRLVENSLRESSEEKVGCGAKLKYMLRRLFPPLEYYRLGYPRLYKTVIAIPFIWGYRIIRAPFRAARIGREIKNIKNTK